MKTYKASLIICIMTLAFQGFSLLINFHNPSENDILGQQRPPLPVNLDEECHIVDAMPLLRKKTYKLFDYKFTKLNIKPLIIEESIKLDKSTNLRVEQRGCEDVYVKFKFRFAGKNNRGIKANLTKAAQLLKKLKINSDTLLNAKTIVRIADVALKESKKNKPAKQTIVCLNETDTECITDVSIKYNYPNLQFYYIDRP